MIVYHPCFAGYRLVSASRWPLFCFSKVSRVESCVPMVCGTHADQDCRLAGWGRRDLRGDLRLRITNQRSLLSRHTQETKNDRCELSCLSKIAHIARNADGGVWGEMNLG